MSILSGLLIATSLMYASISFGETSLSCPGESGYNYTNYRQRNPAKGGFVSNQAFVEDNTDNVFISPTAAVCGSSSVTGRVKIFGTAVINNATITGNVNIKDNARIIGANVSDDAIISGNAYIKGTDIIIREKAQVLGNAKITGDAIIGGTAIIGGYARISTGVYSTEIIKPGPQKGDTPECGLTGSVEDRIVDCSYQSDSVKGSFVLVTRTKELKEVRKDTKSGILWGDRLPSTMNHYDALKACKADLPEVGGIGGLTWRLPSIEEYKVAETDGIRSALLMSGWWWSSSVSSNYSSDAWVFNGFYGNVFDGYRNSDFDSVRCVAR